MNDLATKKKDELSEEAVNQLQSAAPSYRESEKYAALSDKLLNSVLSTKDFSYDMNSDALYNQYKQMYSEEGRKASEHIYGLNTSLTGGYSNSYASSAASAAYGEYMSKLSEKAAELEGRAYERYKDKNEALRENLDTVNALVESDYEKYRNSVSDYYKNEELALSKENQEMKREQLDAQLKSDKISLAFTAAEAGDYSLLEYLGIDTAAIQREREFELALKKAQAGDYSALLRLGVDTSSVEYKNSLEIAQALAKYGDYSGLEKLGIDTTALTYADVLEHAKMLASYGDYSALESLGIDLSDKESEELLEKALDFAKLGDYSVLEKLGFIAPEEKKETEKISINVQNGAKSAYETGGLTGLKKYLNNQVSFGQLTESGKQTILNAYTKI